MSTAGMDSTLEWFGATTFRLKAKGLTIFLDTWLERPSVLPKFLSVDEVAEADYIFISHAHFDHLPGADRLAIKTGAIVIANYEALRLLRAAGVPETQLLPASGGERIPLFTRTKRDAAANGQGLIAHGPPGAPLSPDMSLADLAVHVWPSLHCLMPGKSHSDIPEIMDTGLVYTGAASAYACTVDINRGMEYGLLRLEEHVPVEEMDEGMRSFAEYIGDQQTNIFSSCDGGQLMFNVIIGDKAVLWNAHLGAYDGIMRGMEPKPDVIIMGIAGRANLNGRPFEGSAAQFAVEQVKWLGTPSRVIWCLHDQSCIKPFKVDTKPAEELVEKETGSQVLTMQYATSYQLFR